jgi:hypothetical protein
MKEADRNNPIQEARLKQPIEKAQIKEHDEITQAKEPNQKNIIRSPPTLGRDTRTRTPPLIEAID